MIKKEEIEELLLKELGQKNFQVTDYKDKYCNFILKYPKINITNTLGECHVIRDLYINVEYTNGNSHITGLRGKKSEEEYGSGYNHSHLSSGNGTEFKEFCLGTSELIVVLAEDILKSKDYLEYFLRVLESYLSWESIEGVPFQRMNSISGMVNSESITVSINYSSTIPYVKSLKVNSNLKVRNTEEIEVWLWHYIEKEVSSYYRDDYSVVKVGNKYYKNLEIRIPSNLPYLFKFNGEDIQLKVEKNENKEKGTKVAHPAVTQGFCKYIRKEIRNNYIRNNSIRQEISS